MANSYILSIDQGTTSSRAIVYDQQGTKCGIGVKELPQHYPRPGWVEHDGEEIWQTICETVPQALQAAGIEGTQLSCIGLTNQRETSLFWDKADGRPLAHALVWQDRRTADFCRKHQADADWLHQRTGLILDPYFAGTKIRWMLEQDASLRSRAEQGTVAAGTVDSFLIWRLTNGKVFASDVTNASRTLLLDLKTAQWDEELCKFFSIPGVVLPEVRPSGADYGVTSGLDFLPDGIPITGVAGDQQAALFGQCGFSVGEAKCTYGTGAFFLQHLGDQPILSRHRLVTSLAATLDDTPLYIMEGSIFIAGAAVQWLRDGLKLIDTAPQVEELAESSDLEQPVIFVPGMVGLGAPHWIPEARGVLFGLTRGTTSADLGRAALEGVAYQVVDLIEAASEDVPEPMKELRVDGGMANNKWFLQSQADVLGLPVLQAAESESTALGAAYLAGLKQGVWKDFDELRQLTRAAKRFEPVLDEAKRQERLKYWRRAVQAVIGFYTPE